MYRTFEGRVRHSKKRRTDEFFGAPPLNRSGPIFISINYVHTLRPCIALWMSMSICPHLSAQIDTSDSAPLYDHPSVTVEGSRLFYRSASTLGSVAVVGRRTLARLAGRSIDAVLSDEAGLFVRDFGGPGGVKTVSIRGSSANQTVVLFNGIRLNNMQNGLADLGLLPVELFDAVEVVRGGQSALFGPDASSGAIILSSGPGSASGGTFTARIGSFEDQGVSASGTIADERLSITVRGGTEATGGAFPFPWDGPDGSTTYARHGSSFERTYGSVSTILRPNSTLRLESSVIGILADRGSPGPVTAGGWTHARLRDGLVLGGLRFSSVGDAATMWEGGVSATYQDEEFAEELSAAGTSDRYFNRSASVWLHGRLAVTSELMAGWGIEALHATLSGSAFDAGTKRSGGSLLGHMDWTESMSRVRVLPTVRLDMFSDLSPQVSPRIAAMVPVDERETMRLRGSAGMGFRMPSFNELYWRSGGNRNLNHERTASADIGLEWKCSAVGEHRLTGAAFVSEARDRIVGWPPVNIARTFSRGLEWSWSWTFSGSRVWWTGSWTMVESREPGSEGRQIPFMPRHVFATGADLDAGLFTISPVVQYQSRRFLTTENLAALSVPQSTRASISASGGIRVSSLYCRMALVMKNVFDASDVSLPGYPLPGRSLTFTATVSFETAGTE